MRFLTPPVIAEWATTRPIEQARAVLPELIARLIASDARNAEVSRYRFLTGECSELRGYDGVVDCNRGNSWIERGHSVWEIGTSKTPLRKASGDFSNRNQDPLDRIPGDTAFYAITPHILSDKDRSRWTTERQSCGWKKIQIYDALDLDRWLQDSFPSVRRWFSRKIGVEPEHGFVDIGEHWDRIAAVGGFTLNPSVFLASRVTAVERCDRWLAERADVLALSCAERQEAIEFFAAYCMSQHDERRHYLLANTAIVTSRDTWEDLTRDRSVPRILIPNGPDVVETLESVRRNHHVLCTDASMVRSPDLRVVLARPRPHDVAAALQTSGITSTVANAVCRRGVHSITVVRWRLSDIAVGPLKWSFDSDTSAAVSAAFLLGGWDRANDADAAALSSLSGLSFNQFSQLITGVAASQPDLFVCYGTQWRVATIDRAFEALPPPTGEIIDRWSVVLENAFLPVAQDHNRDVEDGREATDNTPCRAGCSPTLRSQLSKVAAFIGAWSDERSLPQASRLLPTITRVMGRVFLQAPHGPEWKSLAPYLPVLCEAAPQQFLDAIELSLKSNRESLRELFATSAIGWPAVALIWGLETVSWSRDYFARACMLLLQLAELEPSGHRHDAKDSLVGIFSYWYPQSTVSTQEQLTVLDRLVRDFPEAAWGLLIDLLPGARRTASPIQSPVWRDWAHGWQEGAIPRHTEHFLRGLWDLVLRECGGKAECLAQLLRRLASFPTDRKADLITAIERCANETCSDSSRSTACVALATLPDDALLTTDERTAAINKLSPTSLIEKHAPLFAFHPSQFLNEQLTWDDNARRIASLRADAVREICTAHDFPGLMDLLQRAEAPQAVGAAIADSFADTLLPACIAMAQPGNEAYWTAFTGFACARFCGVGWQWCDAVLPLVTEPEVSGRILALLPLDPTGWRKAQMIGDTAVESYWRHCTPYSATLVETQDLTLAASALLERGRFDTAVMLLLLMANQNASVPSSLVIDCLMHPSAHCQDHDFRGSNDGFAMNLIALLRRRGDVSRRTLARLEVRFIRLYDQFARSPTRRERAAGGDAVGLTNSADDSLCALNQLLAHDPDEFVALVHSSVQATDHDQHHLVSVTPPLVCSTDRDTALRALDACDFVPGETPAGTIDEHALTTWCEHLLAKAAATGMQEPCAFQLGQLLSNAFCPRAPGAVQHALEGLLTSATPTCELVARGFSQGLIRNNFNGGLFHGEGGDRRAAAELRQHADELAVSHPQIATQLRNAAQQHEREAQMLADREAWRDD